MLPVILYSKDDFSDICQGDNTIMCITDHQTNPYGMPIISSIYKKLEGLEAINITCEYYGYVNGDILLSSNIDRVLKLIQKQQQRGNLKKHVFVTGRRLNKEVFDRSVFRNVYDYNRFINEVYYNEPLYSAPALDYFIINKGTFDLEAMPDIVIGRGEIDAWQFSTAYANPDCDIIDTSDASGGGECV